MTVRLLVLVLVVLVAGCGADERPALPQGSDPVELDPADFSAEIDHPYWPMQPGTTWVYREGDQRVEVTVTDRTRTVMGIGISAGLRPLEAAPPAPALTPVEPELRAVTTPSEMGRRRVVGELDALRDQCAALRRGVALIAAELERLRDSV